MTSDKLGKALGIVHVDVAGANLDLKLQMGDSRNFRRVVLNPTYSKDKPLMFEKFEDFMVKLIMRDHSDLTEEDVKRYVEFNCMQLFEKMMVGLGITSQEEYEKAKNESTQDLKKLIEDG